MKVPFAGRVIVFALKGSSSQMLSPSLRARLVTSQAPVQQQAIHGL